MQKRSSIKSTALEIDVDLRRDGWRIWLGQMLSRHALGLAAIVLIIFFSFDTENFASVLTLQALLGDKSIVALLALAATVTMIVGKIDLNVGYGMVLWHILPISLQVYFGFSWQTAVVIVLALSLLYGLLNGLLVTLADIDSFVATLGTGTVIYAIALWHSGGHQVVGDLPDGFGKIFFTNVGIFPIVSIYAIALAIVLWIVTAHTPVGRAMYAVGGNPIAATLNGIKVNRYIIVSFMLSSFITACTGIILAAKLGVGQASVGQDFLLPALVGAFLGSTTINPGRVNIWGTMIAVALLAIGTTGIQQFGSAFFVEPLFNGSTLVVALALAGILQRKKIVQSVKKIAKKVGAQ